MHNNSIFFDIEYDVRTDSKGKDPDAASYTLKRYHQLLWSRQLPNGQMMVLTTEKCSYLRWNDLYLASDSITTTFRNGRNTNFEFFKQQIPNYDDYEREFLKVLYTIGGFIVFPQLPWSMNQARGCVNFPFL